jgi:hypothetical protein
VNNALHRTFVQLTHQLGTLFRTPCLLLITACVLQRVAHSSIEQLARSLAAHAEDRPDLAELKAVQTHDDHGLGPAIQPPEHPAHVDAQIQLFGL